MDRWMPGQPVVNAYHFSRLPVGTWTATSTWRVAGPVSSVEPVVLSGLLDAADPPITLLTLAGSEASVANRLTQSLDGCPSLMAQWRAAWNRVGDVLALPPRESAAPSVRLLVVPPFMGSAGVRLSLSQTPGGLDLYMATALPDSTTCLWAAHWVSETLDTMLHEWAHFNSFARRGPAADVLREEFMAYSVGECVHRAIQGQDVARNRSFPSLQALTLAQIFAAVEQGRLPETIAARYLAHHYWAVERPRRSTLDWRAACQQIEEVYPDPKKVFHDE